MTQDKILRMIEALLKEIDYDIYKEYFPANPCQTSFDDLSTLVSIVNDHLTRPRRSAIISTTPQCPECGSFDHGAAYCTNGG